MVSRRWALINTFLLSVGVGGFMYTYGYRQALRRPSGHDARSGAEIREPTQAEFREALEALLMVLPGECVSTDRSELKSHGTSEWSYHNPPNVHGAVLYPRSTSDVVQIVKIAAKYRIPLVPYAGGTSLEGHFDAPPFRSLSSPGPSKPIPSTTPDAPEQQRPELPTGYSWSLDFSENMAGVLEVHDKDMDVVVQPGVKYEVLNEELKGRGLFFPVDPGPVSGISLIKWSLISSSPYPTSESVVQGAAIGGMIGTGCSGTNAVRYGTMRENVINLTVVLPSGEVIKTRQRAKKSSAGPDLGRLFIGAEGTLGIVTEATLRLQPLLPTTVAVTSFPSVHSAVDAVVSLTRAGVPLQCVEFLDEVMMKAVNKASSGGDKWEERPSLFLKFAGEGEKAVRERTAEIVKRHQGGKLKFARSEKEKEDLWYARKVALWSAMEYVPGARCWTTDVCVPISALPQLVEETKEDLDAVGLTAPFVGHVGDGNFHALILFRNDDELEKARGAVHRMVERAQRLDGTCTGEHGVGVGKIEHLEKELGKGTLHLLRDVKKMIDPLNIMNPGKLIPMDEGKPRPK